MNIGESVGALACADPPSIAARRAARQCSLKTDHWSIFNVRQRPIGIDRAME
jgi:hypothetical protein